MAAASLWAEVCLKSYAAGETSDELFQLFLGALHLLDTAETRTEPYVTIQFLWRFLSLAGYQPVTDACCQCGAPFHEKSASFSPAIHGFLCSNCVPANGRSVPAGALRYLAASGQLPLSSAAGITLDAAGLSALRHAMPLMVQAVLEGSWSRFEAQGLPCEGVRGACLFPRTAVESSCSSSSPLPKRVSQLRWVSESAYHLTLHFFGEVEGDASQALRRVFTGPGIEKTARSWRNWDRWASSPTGGNPRVIWVGLREDNGALQSYWELFESAVSPLGWEPDKRGFTPHVTLARNPGSRVAPGWDAAARLPDVPFSVRECVLFQSILGRGGAEYVPLERIGFDGGAA